PPVGIGLASFKDYNFLCSGWNWIAAAIGIAWAKPRRREFRIAIDYVVDNCRRKYYGKNPLYPTGPVVFGRALIAAEAEQNQQEKAEDRWIGIMQPLTPGKQNENCCYIAPDHSLIAIKVKSIGGDLTHLGAMGTNNYNHFWHARRVYGE